MIELLGNGIVLDNNCEIKEFDTNDGIVMAFCYNGHIQSLIYKDKEKSNELAFYYFNFFDLPVRVNPNGNNYLVLGGGGLSYPRYYLSHYDNKKMDVVEIDKKIIEYAKNYFYFDENELSFKKNHLNIIIDDALNYISYCDKKYDYILVDLFNGNIPVTSIYGDKYINDLKRIMNDNGIIVINYIISSINKGNMEFLKLLYSNFKYFKVISNSDFFDKKHGMGNIIILLSNNYIDIPIEYDYIELSEYFKY